MITKKIQRGRGGEVINERRTEDEKEGDRERRDKKEGGTEGMNKKKIRDPSSRRGVQMVMRVVRIE